MMRSLSLILVVSIHLNYSASTFFVSTTGLSTNTGSINSPWDLQTAFNHPVAVQPGDTIYLRGGTYIGFYTSTLTGTSGNQIIVSSYNKEWAKICDTRQNASGGTLNIDGSYTTYINFEICNTNTSRTSAGSHVFRPMGIEADGDHIKLINLIIHDTGHGIGFWAGCVDSEMYGCIIYNCGTENSLGNYITHGHGIYTQNNTGTKLISNNIVFNQFGFGLHAYPDPGNVSGYNIINNIFFHNGALTDTTFRLNNILFNKKSNSFEMTKINIVNNFTYDKQAAANHTSLFDSDVNLGELGLSANNLLFRKNHLMCNSRSGLIVINWDSLQVDSNTIYSTDGNLALVKPLSKTYLPSNWNNNTYYGGSQTLQFSYQTAALTNFATWKSQTGLDNFSSFAGNAPNLNELYILPNAYKANSGIIVIYNWEKLNNINVNISSLGFLPGDKYMIRNVLDYFNDTTSAIYGGLNIIVPMNNRTVAPAIGVTNRTINTFPEFGVFVIEKKETSSTGTINLTNNEYVSINWNNMSQELHVIGEAGEFELFNSIGELVKMGYLQNNSAVQFGQLPSGVYLIKYQTSSGRQVLTKKIALMN